MRRKPWLEPNEYGERPGDICCLRSGGFCYEHDRQNYRNPLIKGLKRFLHRLADWL